MLRQKYTEMGPWNVLLGEHASEAATPTHLIATLTFCQTWVSTVASVLADRI